VIGCTWCRPNATKETIMADFPLWLKLLVWLMLGAVVVYTAVNILINVF
jgi:hypothetical protein